MNEKKFIGIKLEHINLFDKLLQKTSTSQHVWIKKEYENNYNNFRQLLSVLTDSKLIIQTDKKIFLAPTIHELNIDNFLVHLINHSEYSNHIQKYIESYKKIDGQIAYKPNRSDNVKYSNIRNLLIDSDFIHYNASSNIYYFHPNKYESFLNILYKSGSVISPEVLKIIKESQEEIGYKAELEVLKYEEKRLKDYQKLQNRISHVSQKDSSAGYDIKSWLVELDKGTFYECYIEVKAVSKDNLKFYWSRNELLKAKREGSKYLLYLVPVVSKDKFDLKNIEIIPDPYTNVFKSEDWAQQIESYSFKHL